MKSLSYQLLASTIGLPIAIISNDYQEIPIPEDINKSYHKIVFKIKEEEPDIFAIGVLFTLSLLSFTFAAPRGYSELEFVPDEEWNLEYFVHGAAGSEDLVDYINDPGSLNLSILAGDFGRDNCPNYQFTP